MSDIEKELKIIPFTARSFREMDSVVDFEVYKEKVSLALDEIKKLQAENAELKKQGEWVDASSFEEHLSDGDLCWVLFKDGAIIKCFLNDYRCFGGNSIYWQDLRGNDLTMPETKFIKICKPTPPKGE